MIHSLAYEIQEEFYNIERLRSDSKETCYCVFRSDKTLEQLTDASNRVLDQAGGWNCNCEHDCCGCWGMIDMRVAQIGEHAFILVENWRQDY
jgi:hypothetical protein